jgi:L-seryl-tRNA(Ser) seleniumtransferase
MAEKMSRRKLLHKGGCGVLAGAVGACASPALRASEPPSAATPATGVDYYQKLGVAPFINAAGTYTVFSASTMPDEV